MKKFVSIALIVLVMMMALTSVVSAATEADIIAKLEAADVPAEYIALAESYLADNEVDAATADAIIANIDAAVAIAAGASAGELTAAQHSAIAAEITEAANELGLSTTYSSETGLSVVDATGNTLVTVSAESDELTQTGFDYSIVLAGMALIMVAGASAVVIRKKVRQN